MRYSGQKIEDTIFNAIRGLKLPINGKVYKAGTRPMNSTKEDCVVSFLTGTSSQIQTANVIVNVFVPDIQAGDGQFYKNTKRCLELESQLLYLEHTFIGTELFVSIEDMIMTIKVKGINQHCVSVNLRTKVLTE